MSLKDTRSWFLCSVMHVHSISSGHSPSKYHCHSHRTVKALPLNSQFLRTNSPYLSHRLLSSVGRPGSQEKCWTKSIWNSLLLIFKDETWCTEQYKNIPWASTEDGGAKGCKLNWHWPLEASAVMLISSGFTTTAEPCESGNSCITPKPNLISLSTNLISLRAISSDTGWLLNSSDHFNETITRRSFMGSAAKWSYNERLTREAISP